jgi:2-polyprenyl-3-methyl-5-hydroxy-6-metoxy-1,4-benzoquinol methylase
MNPVSLVHSLRSRHTAPELMDLVSCDPVLLEKTVRQFGLINRLFSASLTLIDRGFFGKMEKDRNRTYTLLDAGAGGCDICIRIIKEARKRGISLRITAIDRDERVLSVAREAIMNTPEITVVSADVNNLEALGDFDFIFCNHLLHHLTWEEIGRLLRAVERRAGIAFLLNDLKRSGWAYAGYSLFAALCLRPSLAYFDGRLSIRKGFVETELKELLRTNLPGIPVSILRAFPARLALYRCKI